MCQVADVSNVTHLYLPRDNLHYHACIHDTKADSYWRLLLKVGSKTNIMVNFKIVENMLRPGVFRLYVTICMYMSKVDHFYPFSSIYGLPHKTQGASINYVDTQSGVHLFSLVKYQRYTT